MKINVIQEDIDNGVRCSSGECPIALAVKRENKRFFGRISPWVSVGVDLTITGSFFGKFHFYTLPSVASNFLANFDSGRPVKPFSFEVSEKWVR